MTRGICVIEVSCRTVEQSYSTTKRVARLSNIATMWRRKREDRTEMSGQTGHPNRDESVEEDSRFGRSLLGNPFRADERMNNRRISNVSNDEDDVDRRRNLDLSSDQNPTCATLTNEDSRIESISHRQRENENIDTVCRHRRTIEDKRFDFGLMENVFGRNHRNLRSVSNENQHDTFDSHRITENSDDDYNSSMNEGDRQR
jgi:hypothetical protein